jgi:hypothetical protein
MKNKYWFKINLGDAMLAGIAQEELEKSFSNVIENTVHSKEMAMFIRHENQGRLHCELVVYFSPACDSIATKLDATPCMNPSVNDLSLCIGDSESIALLFPELS